MEPSLWGLKSPTSRRTASGCLLGDEELAVPFSDFPWFKKATIEQLSDVQRPTEDHLYWPQIDVDLSVESIRTPESFPLVSKSAA